MHAVTGPIYITAIVTYMSSSSHFDQELGSVESEIEGLTEKCAELEEKNRQQQDEMEEMAQIHSEVRMAERSINKKMKDICRLKVNIT